MFHHPFLLRLVLWFVPFAFCLFPGQPAWSAVSINRISQLQGLKFRLVPRNPDSVDGLGIKTVEVRRTRGGVQVRWFSPNRIQTAEKPWPEYRIKLERGLIQTTGLDEAQALAHPHLWIHGSVILDGNGLLWVPSKIIAEASKKKSYRLEPGFLSPSFASFKKGPARLIKKIEEFRRLVLPTPEKLNEETGKKKMKSKKGGSKELDKFVEAFSRVQVLSSSKKQALVINGKKTDVPVVVLGNKFLEYTVLKSSRNPLILTVSFKNAKVPRKLRSLFSFFHKNLEYRITQINTGS